jgi:hypothetical protein
MKNLIYFINCQQNKNEIWSFIEFEQPGRCGWRNMYNYNKLDLICNFCLKNDINMDIDIVMDYLKVYRLFGISYEIYIKNKYKYNILIFNYYYNNGIQKL